MKDPSRYVTIEAILSPSSLSGTYLLLHKFPATRSDYLLATDHHTTCSVLTLPAANDYLGKSIVYLPPRI